jgi:antitoxin component YwqK of YwqJK toxin-antitoxin module
MFGEVFVSYKEYKNEKGILHKEWRNHIGELHRMDGPAYIEHYAEGSVRMEIFVFNGKTHREGAPAAILYMPNGMIELEGFYRLGKQYRQSGPQSIGYYPDGSIKFEGFVFNGISLGKNKGGFWRLWDKINEDERKNPTLLKYLAKYS